MESLKAAIVRIRGGEPVDENDDFDIGGADGGRNEFILYVPDPFL